MLLIGIVLPVVMQGIATATSAAAGSRHRTEAAALAQAKVQELTALGTWDGGATSGDCGPDWPAYKWQMKLTAWTGDTAQVGLQQLDVTITWTERGQPVTQTVSTLVYVRPVPAS